MIRDHAALGIDFRPWDKIARLKRSCIITEKIDGTNAAVGVTDDGQLYAQSRNRFVTPEADNAGFATWCAANEDELVGTLGPGLHFGEWWGAGIQRRYGMDHKVFSLFDVTRWHDLLPDTNGLMLRTVPWLYLGDFTTDAVDVALARLADGGSVAAPGYMWPEGVVVYLPAARRGFKVTLDDDGHKGTADTWPGMHSGAARP